MIILNRFERLWTVWTILGKTVHNLPKRYNIVLTVQKSPKPKIPESKGSYHKKNYHQKLIFWIVMGCGEARFGRKGQKTPKIENFGLKFFPLGSRGDPHSRARGNLR